MSLQGTDVFLSSQESSLIGPCVTPMPIRSEAVGAQHAQESPWWHLGHAEHCQAQPQPPMGGSEAT